MLYTVHARRPNGTNVARADVPEAELSSVIGQLVASRLTLLGVKLQPEQDHEPVYLPESDSIGCTRGDEHGWAPVR